MKLKFWRHGLYFSALKHVRKVQFGMCVPIYGINTSHCVATSTGFLIWGELSFETL